MSSSTSARARTCDVCRELGGEDGVRPGRGGHSHRPQARHYLLHQALRRERTRQKQGGPGTPGTTDHGAQGTTG
jgi:hypothetical protein